MEAVHNVVAIVVILVALGFAVREAGNFRASGPQRVSVRGDRATGRVSRAAGRATGRQIWVTARATDWLERQRHFRKTGTYPPGRTMRGAQATGRSARSVAGAANRGLRAVGRHVRRPPAPSAEVVPVTPAQATRPSPARPAVPATSTNGRTPAMSTGASTGSAEKLIEGVNEIHNIAASGGIFAKHGSIKAAHEGMTRFADMCAMLSRTLAESHYGPEITEPLSKAGTHARASAVSLSEGDAAVNSLINGNVGDHVRSGRQLPDRRELSENGNH